MSSTLKTILGTTLILILVIVGILVVADHAGKVAGATTPSQTTAFYSTESMGSPLLILGGAAAGPNSGSNLQIQPTTGTCTTGTSTMFAVANPFAATSTVTLAEVWGQNAARTTDFFIGTTTLPSVAATSTVNSNLIAMASIASGAQFFSVAGLKTGPGLGYTSPAGGAGGLSNPEIVVGPTENIVGYATSTGIAGGNGVTSCTYKFLWVSQ